MQTSASDGKQRVTTRGVMNKEPDGTLSVPLRNLTILEAIALGMRVTMFELGNDGIDDAHGYMACGAGLGTDAIEMVWTTGGETHRAFVRGIELFKAWVASYAPDDAAKFPEGVR